MASNQRDPWSPGFMILGQGWSLTSWRKVSSEKESGEKIYHSKTLDCHLLFSNMLCIWIIYSAVHSLILSHWWNLCPYEKITIRCGPRYQHGWNKEEMIINTHWTIYLFSGLFNVLLILLIDKTWFHLATLGTEGPWEIAKTKSCVLQ